jgi:hypothetical protein
LRWLSRYPSELSFSKACEGSSFFGHWLFLESGGVLQPDVTHKSSMADRKPLAHHGAMEGAIDPASFAELHHHSGRTPDDCFRARRLPY